MAKDPEMHAYPDPDCESSLQTTEPKKTDSKAADAGTTAPASPADSNQ